MYSSFSLSRLGVSNRLRIDRARVWSGGSMVIMCSFIGNWSRWASISAVMSSPSGRKGSGGNGPPRATMLENVSASL